VGVSWQDVEWRAHQRWVDVDGRWANVVDVGDGPPLVLVHGLGGTWRHWLETIPRLMHERRVVAMDLPGFGDSEMPGERISIAGYGRWVDAVCERLELGTAAVAGSSMGGFIAAELAIRVPDRVERLALVSAAGLTVEHQRNDAAIALLRRTQRLMRLYVGVVAQRAHSLARRRQLRRLLLANAVAVPGDVPGPLAGELISGAGKPGFVDALDAVTSYPIRERLPRIACPTLIVWGARDRLVPVSDADEFEQLIPDTRKVIYQGTGHGPMLERPEAFVADLRAFLEEEPQAEAPGA
jgi:pimeloyl-ACP methyl ester carboxylesterase